MEARTDRNAIVRKEHRKTPIQSKVKRFRYQLRLPRHVPAIKTSQD
jgi:hypothetical protein